MFYGATNAMWAKLNSDTSATALPTYDSESVVEFDGVNESNDSPTFAEASAYGDNKKAITVREFSGGTIESKMVHISSEEMAVLSGATTDEDGGLSYGGDDDAPFGGYGFVCYKMDSKKNRYYQVIFYPKVQAYVEAEDHKTKEDSITLEYDAVSFNWFQPECKIYKVKREFQTEAEATTYLKGLLDGTETAPGLTAES